jgi:hypothetical protein
MSTAPRRLQIVAQTDSLSYLFNRRPHACGRTTIHENPPSVVRRPPSLSQEIFTCTYWIENSR